MAQLNTVLAKLGLEGEVSPLGRWARLQGERGMVYVAHAAFGEGYYSWCDAPQERTAQPYLDPAEAIQAALQRARQPQLEKQHLSHSVCPVSRPALPRTIRRQRGHPSATKQLLVS